MSNKINFKVFIVNENDQEHKLEARRFVIDSNAVTNFSYLREKLQNVFPNIREQQFAIFWKDNEGDAITISNREELEIALEEMKNSKICKLYIMLNSNCKYTNFQNYSDNLDGSTNLQKEHVNIQCDACNKGIWGFRYKCLQCPDYDLCNNCESKGLHSEHFMIRISVPMQWNSYYEKRLFHNINKFLRKTSYATSEGKRNHTLKSKQYSNSDADNLYYQVPSWTNNFFEYLNTWRSGHLAEPDKKVIDTDYNSTVNQSTVEDKKIAELISHMFNTFGIDANVQIHSQKYTATSNTTSAMNQIKTHVDTCTNSTKLSDELPRKADESGPELKSLLLQKNQSSKENLKILENEVSDTANWIFLDNENMNSAKSNSSSSNTVSSEQKNNPTSEESTHNPDDQKLYPIISNTSNSNLYENSIISQAVEKMMEMGISNENGSLSKRVLSIDRDITKH